MSAGLSYASYERPLVAPFRYGNKSISSRRGFLLRRSDGLISEAAPLPGHSTDDFSEVKDTLASRSSTELLAAEGRENLPASLRFALEGLELLGSPGSAPVRANALLRYTTHEDARAQLNAFGRAGFRVCKLKLPPENWEPYLDLVSEFAPLRFRLDCNLAFDPARLLALLNTIEERSLAARVEYIEEPFPGVWDMRTFRGSPVPLAADESAPNRLLAMRLLDRANPPDTFVVKPTVAGGLISLEPFLAALAAAGKRTVFTSAIETEAGRRVLLAFLSREKREVCGISTGSLFRENYLEDRAEWTGVPVISMAEQEYLTSLPWMDCP